jgi:uncharacterized protein (TIGR02594 family)
MAFKTIRATALFKEHARDAVIISPLLSGIVLAFDNEKAREKDDDWIRVVFAPPGGGKTIGWVLAAHCEEVSDLPRPELKVDGFLRSCLMAEASFNQQETVAPWFVAADFVIARAIIETDLTNSGPKITGSDAVGPLQVSSAEWDAFLRDGGNFAKEFEKDDRDDPQLQIFGAIYRMHADTKAISKVKIDRGTGTQDDPFVPSYLDVFHTYLTNSMEAAVAIRDAQDSEADKNKKVSEVLNDRLNGAQSESLFNGHEQLKGKISPTQSVGEFAAATEGVLNDALKKAFDLIKENCPEELPSARQGEAPWFDFAETQEAAGIAEPDPRILDYFDATDFRPKPRSTNTPWCGAFASSCMKQSGDATAAASVPPGSAAAVNWRNWGASLTVKPEDLPLGAVVVLSPFPGTGGTGHVGFFSQFLNDGKTVELLGGNQSNKVKRSQFPASRIVAIRWLDLAPVTTDEEAPSEAEPPAEAQATQQPAQPQATQQPAQPQATQQPARPQAPQQPAQPQSTQKPAPPSPVQKPAPPAAGPRPGGPAKLISDKARDLIVFSEVSSRAAYDKRYCRPEWPQGRSGVTIGIGYDCGYTTRDGLQRDWQGAIPQAMIAALGPAVGVKGSAAGPLARRLRASVNVPYAAAISVFDGRDVPKWVAMVRRALPNTELLNPDCLGALVSLAYNRGASFSNQGGRYAEMRAIRTHMANKDFARIPAEFRSMKRLWPSMRGLLIRRENEAQLFEFGLGIRKTVDF